MVLWLSLSPASKGEICYFKIYYYDFLKLQCIKKHKSLSVSSSASFYKTWDMMTKSLGQC